MQMPEKKIGHKCHGVLSGLFSYFTADEFHDVLSFTLGSSWLLIDNFAFLRARSYF